MGCCSEKCKCGNVLKLKWKKLDDDAVIPQYKTKEAAGFDFSSVENYSIPPMGQVVVKTGLACDIPAGYQIEVRPRSGLAFKHSITVVNSPGTIDSDYVNEIMVIMFNLGKEEFIVEKGDRIAQGVLMPAPQALMLEVDEFEAEKEDRGGGFGSTGVK